MIPTIQDVRVVMTIAFALSLPVASLVLVQG